MTADTSNIGDPDGISNATFSYQWIAGTADISGATGFSYAPLVADLGKTIKVRVSFEDDQNNFESLTSAATGAVTASPYGAVIWSGTMTVGMLQIFGVSLFGFDAPNAGTSLDIGDLEPSAFSYAGNSYIIETIAHFSDSGELEFGLDVPLVSGDFNLNLDGTPFLVRSDGNTSLYAFSNHGLSWTNGQEVAVWLAVNRPATGAPVIGGTAQVGETLTAETSAIDDADGLDNVGYSYQWLANDAEIAGATDPTYTLVDDDAGLTIKVKVSFFDDKNNPETLTSAAATAVLANVPGAPEHLNVSLRDTGALDVSWEAPSTDGGYAITEYWVQWKETAGNWDTPADVSEETASRMTHTITGLTDGVEYAVRVIAVNDVGDGPPLDEAMGTPRETTPPELSTATVDGATLTLTYDEDLDEASGLASDAFSVTVGGLERAVDGVSVSGSSVILTLGSAVTAADTVTVTYTVPTDAAAPRIQDDAGNPAASFSDQDVENNTPPPANTPATGAPTISGTVQVGKTLTASTSDIDDADGLDNVGYSYQWLANGADIAGATSSSYTLVDADKGKTIQVKVSFRDDKNNPETLTSAATAAVTARPNSPATGAPTISGTVRVGETLTVETSAITEADGMSGAVFSYQWLADDADIAGATSDTYTLVDADLEKAQGAGDLHRQCR